MLAHLNILLVIEVLGTAAFTVSGVFAAMERRFDLFGILVIGFVTAVGGGTVRDLLIGRQPVSWMMNDLVLLVIPFTTIIAVLFRNVIRNMGRMLLIFDALGLGLFTIAGIQSGITAGFSTGIGIALGTITGCFGGVLRDLLLNKVPVLFQKEIYATACIAGGVVYVLLLPQVPRQVADITAVVLICTIRLVAVHRNWRLPSVYGETGNRK
jgi:uncharacterized membrane protein YeiH